MLCLRIRLLGQVYNAECYVKELDFLSITKCMLIPAVCMFCDDNTISAPAGAKVELGNILLSNIMYYNVECKMNS